MAFFLLYRVSQNDHSLKIYAEERKINIILTRKFGFVIFINKTEQNVIGCYIKLKVSKASSKLWSTSIY